MSAVAEDIARLATVDKARGYWTTVFRRLSRDRVSVVCAAIILLIGGVVARVHEVRGGRSQLTKAEVEALKVERKT